MFFPVASTWKFLGLQECSALTRDSFHGGTSLGFRFDFFWGGTPELNVPSLGRESPRKRLVTPVKRARFPDITTPKVTYTLKIDGWFRWNFLSTWSPFSGDMFNFVCRNDDKMPFEWKGIVFQLSPFLRGFLRVCSCSEVSFRVATCEQIIEEQTTEQWRKLWFFRLYRGLHATLPHRV